MSAFLFVALVLSLHHLVAGRALPLTSFHLLRGGPSDPLDSSGWVRSLCGCSSMAEHQLPKLKTAVFDHEFCSAVSLGVTSI
jgi:hypothetical protein